MHKINVYSENAGDAFYDEYFYGIVQNRERNKQIAKIAAEACKKGKSVLILCKILQHGDKIQGELDTLGVEAQFCNGTTDKKFNYDELNRLRSGKSKILIMSRIGEAGVDVPCLDVVIRASGGKSTVNTLQSLGRGLRAKNKGTNTVDFHDFMDVGNTHLAAHSHQRIKDYEREGFDVVYD
jgi:superfamily II DNA or RNA helicase